MSEFIYRIQEAMKKSYSHINLFLQEFSGYLEMVKRQETTDYSNLTTKKFESVNDMFLNLVKLNELIGSSLKENLE